MALSLQISGCAQKEIVRTCPSAVLPSDFVAEYFEGTEIPAGVDIWYGEVMTTMCLLDGGTSEECGE